MTNDRHPKFDPRKHHRKSVRLPGYDYSSEGAYYVTIVTYHRDCLFGEVRNRGAVLNEYGKIADICWRSIPDHFPFVELGAYVIMPNHVHGIIIITDDRRGTIYRAPTQEQFQKPVSGSLPTIVRTYKAAVTRQIGREHNATGIWQRNYYEHIIRDEKDLQNKTDYIEANPILWDEDDVNPRNNPLP
ncbi:MAG: transposase [Chloroflexi bacterium]|nr:transposase [Chloroflexota bacterium]